jgi:hypothetical protein
MRDHFFLVSRPLDLMIVLNDSNLLLLTVYSKQDLLHVTRQNHSSIGILWKKQFIIYAAQIIYPFVRPDSAQRKWPDRTGPLKS